MSELAVDDGYAAEGYSDPPKTETIDGVEYDMAAGSFNHAVVIARMLSILNAYFRGKSCIPFTSELEIYLGDNTFRPDISVVCDFSKKTESGYNGAPTLIVEVLSPSTAWLDYGK
jgi:Uma2 family endonuclease